MCYISNITIITKTSNSYMFQILLIYHEGIAAPSNFVQCCTLHISYTKNFQQLFYIQQNNTLSNRFIQLLCCLVMDPYGPTEGVSGF
jgi:hypothetical protein